MAATNISSGRHIFPNGTVWVCEPLSKFQRTKGIFFGENPLNFMMSLFLLQTSVAGFLTSFLQFLLIPLGESSFFPHMLAGVILGPSVLGQFEFVKKWLFPEKTFYITQTIAFIGSSLFMFLLGVKIDLTTIRRTGKKACATGLASFVIPLLLSTSAALIIRKILSPHQSLYKSILYVAFLLTTGSFHVTAIYLTDLKLLNSEIGRLSISSSMLSGVISMLWVVIIIAERQSRLKRENPFNLIFGSLVVMVILISCVLRPIMFWMVRRTPEGKPIKESYIIVVFLMVLGSSLFGEIVGQHFMIGPILLGMAVPDGPPLGSALIERLDTLVSSVLLPLYFLYSGTRFKVFLIDPRSFVVVQFVAMLSFVGKVIGTMLPTIYWKMPFTDALSFGLIMGSQGITQLLYLQTALFLRIIDEQTYGNVLVAILWWTGATTPIVKFLYDPSKRYLSLNRRRTIEHVSSNIELRLMACMHSQEDTPSIMSLLEISNPSTETPICFYVLHLLELIGRAAPVFIDHQPSNKINFNPSHSTHSQHIINAFKSYEQQNSGVVVKLFTSMSPYKTMHDEICMQVIEKRACMLIVPFHRQWRSSNGNIVESPHPIRALNRHLLRIAPCSVGVLIERGGTLSRNNPLMCACFYSVGIIFIEGADDREALAYAMRMATRPNVRITLIRLMEPRKKSKNLNTNRDPDGDMIHKFKVDCIQIKRHDYREEVVRDSVEMVSVIRSLEGCFDLVLVGRCHANESSLLFSGFTEWNEYPELGPLGDMLVASDSTFDGSVLVVQQQKKLEVGHHHDLQLDPMVNRKQEAVTIVEVPRERKVWPII